MHGRIYQLEKLEDIKKNDFDLINADTFIEKTNLINTIADYIVDIEEDKGISHRYEWLVKVLTKFGASYDKENNIIIFPIDFKDKYFADRYNKFKYYADKISFSDFTALLSEEMYILERLYNCKTNYYIANSTYEFDTLDNFIRFLDPEKEHSYKIVNSLNYHC